MATLELVPLRTSLPTGRMTLRHVIPVVNPDDELAALLRDAAGLTEINATPQVASVPSGTGETPAGKGGQAR